MWLHRETARKCVNVANKRSRFVSIHVRTTQNEAEPAEKRLPRLIHAAFRPRDSNNRLKMCRFTCVWLLFVPKHHRLTR